MTYVILKDGSNFEMNEHYSHDGVHIEILEPATDEQKEEIKKQLKEDRDLVSLKFLK